MSSSKLSQAIAKEIRRQSGTAIAEQHANELANKIVGIVNRSYQFLDVLHDKEDQTLTGMDFAELSNYAKAVQHQTDSVANTILELARKRVREELGE